MTATDPPGIADTLAAADHPLTDVREYVRVTPTETPLAPSLVATNVADLHGFGNQVSGLVPWRSPAQPTIEMLLAASGTPNRRQIDYLFGIDEPRRTPDLKETVRGWFPQSYELATTDRSPVDALGLREAAAASLAGDHGDRPDDHTADGVTPLRDRHVGGLEVFGVPDEPDDWQTGLTPFEAFSDGDRARYPLSGVVDALRNTDVPVLYQVLIRPKPDWSADLTARIDELSGGDGGAGGRNPMKEGFDEVFGRPTADAGRDRRRGDRDARDARDATEPGPLDERRVEELQAVDPATSFTVNVRALAFGSEPTATAAAIESLQPRFRKIGQSTYRLATRTYDPGSKRAADLCQKVASRSFTGMDDWPWWLRRHLPGLAPLSPAIVTDPATLPDVTVVGGASLTPGGKRALSTVPPTRRSLRLPNPDVLEPFTGDGFFLGYPVTADGEVWDEGLSLPPELQLLHTVIFAATGHGKSIRMINGGRTNVAVTAGADVFLLPKGGAMADRFMRALYADHGTLENVYYFDCADVLPAISFFDIRPALDAGFDRSTIVHQRIQAFLDVSRLTMAEDTFERAQRSLEVLHWLLTALYDRTFGGNVFGLTDLEDEVRRLQRTGELPPVEDEALRERLQDLTVDGGTVSDAVIQGVLTRVQKVAEHEGVATLFNYQPTASDPRFEFADLLDEDVVVLFDTGGLSDTAQDVLAVVLFAKLWRAVTHRSDVYASRVDTPPVVNLYVEEAKDVAVAEVFEQLLSQGREFGLATLLTLQRPGQLKAEDEETYQELKTEVQTVLAGHQKAGRDVAEWFATDGDREAMQARLAGLSPGEWLGLLPQVHGRPRPHRFKLQSGELPPGYAPGSDVPAAKQFSRVEEQAYRAARSQAEATTARDVGIDNVSFLDATPASAHPETSVDDVSVDRGATRTAAADDTSPAPTDGTRGDLESAADPDAHATIDGDAHATVDGDAHATVDGDGHGTDESPATVDHDAHATVDHDGHGSDDRDGHATDDGEGDADAAGDAASTAVVPSGSVPDAAPSKATRPPSGDEPRAVPDDPADAGRETTADEDAAATATVIDPAPRLSNRLPPMVEVSDDGRFLACTASNSRYERSIDGMRKAIECCHSLDDVRRDDIPICDVTVKLDADERARVPLSDGQLAFMQMVYDAMEFEFGDLEFNPLVDSCRLLRHYAGIDPEDTQELRDKGLVRWEGSHPHLMFSLTPQGRKLINQPHRHGIAFGDGKGDLDETMHHVVAVELTVRFLQEAYVAAEASDATRVKRYHEVGDGRLDVAALDPDGDVVVAAEVERTENHDTPAAVPADYDKMAACDPEEAIWVVMTQSGGHAVLEALSDPADGSPRTDTSYSENTPPRRFLIDEPGCSEIYTLNRLMNHAVDDLTLDD